MGKIIFDFDKLRGRIIEKFGTCGRFAEAMGMSDGQLSDRLLNKVPMDGTEIVQAAALLDIPGDEITTFFLTLKFDK